MKRFKFAPLLSVFLILIGCEQSEKINASIATLEVSNITSYSAELHGKIETAGGLELPILSRGFCWNLKPDPTIFNSSFITEAGLAEYQFETKKLQADKIYYVIAFYINKKDTVYGNQVEFDTQDYLIFNPDLE